MQLEGKVALVTGSGVRIGRAIALGLAGRGAKVLVHYHTSAGPAEEVVEQIKSMGSDALAVQADLRETSRLPELIARGVERYGQVDVLVNSAAIFERGPFFETTEEDWDKHFDVNIKAPFFLSQAYAQALGEGQRGHIINIADWRAVRPGTAYMAYILTKSALITLTQSLAQSLGPNTQVNAIAPGAILPPPEGEEYFERLAKRIPAKRTGSPSEIVKTVLYLLDSDFVTGEVAFVTGGEHLI